MLIFLRSVMTIGIFTICFSQYACCQKIDTTRGLKDYYLKKFPIGVAVSVPSIRNIKESAFIIKNFNSVTPENAMKMETIHPEQDKYDWRAADAIVDFATSNHIRIRGHNLCWHEQVPSWMFYDKENKLVSKTVLLQRLKDHIYTVVKRYKGRIYAWDVVNEAVSDDSHELLRHSLWYKICGDEFIVKAFQYAHEADPEAVLFYNDYNTERPEKRERVYQLLKMLLDAKVPVNGIGLQAHWSNSEPSKKDLTDAIDRFTSLGLKLQITELDISIYPWEKERRDKRAGESDDYSPDLIKKQSDQYAMVFNVFRQYSNVITGVTFWNLSDRNTWLDNYPVKGRKNYPLLFDTDYKPKVAYWRVVNF